MSSDLEYQDQRHADRLTIADAADRLLFEYDRTCDRADALLTEYEGELRLVNLARISKGIYRVSLTGKEGRLGIDHINLVLSEPHAKYGSVSFGEYHGEGTGCIQKDGSIRLWPSVDGRAVRTIAVLAAVEIVLGSADPLKYARAYARASSTCWRCGETLLVGISQQVLMGPSCFRAEYGMTQRQGLKAGIGGDFQGAADIDRVAV